GACGAGACALARGTTTSPEASVMAASNRPAKRTRRVMRSSFWLIANVPWFRATGHLRKAYPRPHPGLRRCLEHVPVRLNTFERHARALVPGIHALTAANKAGWPGQTPGHDGGLI